MKPLTIEWPEIAEVRNVAIGPMRPGTSKSNLWFSADPPLDLLSHYRYGFSEAVSKIDPLIDDDIAATDTIAEPVIYGGPLFRHFGHAIAESLHRLWPRLASWKLRKAKIAFHPLNNANVMPYVAEALSLYGISVSDVIRIDRPMRFSRMFIGVQARQMAGPTMSPDYRRLLDRQLFGTLGPAGGERRLYLSRLHHHHTGSYYGESYVEQLLSKNGFEVIYPEHYSLFELIKMLRASAVAVFAEGSAVHALELCGSATPRVFVIGRRRGSVARFAPLLSNICRRWMVSDHVSMNDGMSLDPKKHSAVVNLEAVLNELRAFAPAAEIRFDPAAAFAAIEKDLEQHIVDPRNARPVDDDRRAEELRAAVLGMFSDMARRSHG